MRVELMLKGRGGTDRNLLYFLENAREAEYGSMP
jgi:hypothetical protein